MTTNLTFDKRHSAIVAASVLAEALNQPEFRQHIQTLYGQRGLARTAQHIRELAESYSFEPPLLENAADQPD